MRRPWATKREDEPTWIAFVYRTHHHESDGVRFKALDTAIAYAQAHVCDAHVDHIEVRSLVLGAVQPWRTAFVASYRCPGRLRGHYPQPPVPADRAAAERLSQAQQQGGTGQQGRQQPQQPQQGTQGQQGQPQQQQQRTPRQRTEDLDKTLKAKVTQFDLQLKCPYGTNTLVFVSLDFPDRPFIVTNTGFIYTEPEFRVIDQEAQGLHRVEAVPAAWCDLNRYFSLNPAPPTTDVTRQEGESVQHWCLRYAGNLQAVRNSLSKVSPGEDINRFEIAELAGAFDVLDSTLGLLEDWCLLLGGDDTFERLLDSYYEALVLVLNYTGLGFVWQVILQIVGGAADIYDYVAAAYNRGGP